MKQQIVIYLSYIYYLTQQKYNNASVFYHYTKIKIALYQNLMIKLIIYQKVLIIMGGSQSKSKKNNSNNTILKQNQTPMQPEKQRKFKVIRHPKQRQIQLNNKYFIKPEHQYAQFAQILVQLIDQKNAKDRGSLPPMLSANYFSSLQFILGQCNMKDEKCMICLQQYKIQKDIQKQLQQSNEHDIYCLSCSHKYHRDCLLEMIQQKQWVKCPVCSAIYGKMTGDQPNGTINTRKDKNLRCEGYENGSIVISYSFKGTEINGKHVPGTSRTAYLPDNKQGNQVCKLLQQAFNRKLTFTIGRSVTTGMDNQIVWNGIHHKTALSGGPGSFGYPDDTYLKRVKQQLALKGITPESIGLK